MNSGENQYRHFSAIGVRCVACGFNMEQHREMPKACCIRKGCVRFNQWYWWRRSINPRAAWPLL